MIAPDSDDDESSATSAAEEEIDESSYLINVLKLQEERAPLSQIIMNDDGVPSLQLQSLLSLIKAAPKKAPNVVETCAYLMKV
jgi:hypothetical protein